MAQRKYPVMSVEDYLILNRNSKDTHTRTNPHQTYPQDSCMYNEQPEDKVVRTENRRATPKAIRLDN